MPIFSPFTTHFKALYGSLCKRSSTIRRFFCPAAAMVYADNTAGSITPETLLVLPPNDYWAQRVKLNVKTEQEAIKYGPALFDVGEEYGFQAQKSGESLYVIVAYSKTMLSQKFQETPALSVAKKLTFAQWVFADETKPIRLKNNKYLTVVDGIVIEMDSAYLKSDSSVTIEEVLAQDHPFIKTLSLDVLLPTQIMPKTLKMTLVILLLLLANLVTQIIMDRQLANEASETIQTIQESSHLSPVSIEREAILASLKQKEEKQLRLRQQCYLLSTLPLKVAQAVSAPPAAAAPSAVNPSSAEGIVLIPGSKPGDPNRLLVGDSVNAPNTAAIGAAGIQELFYDGNNLKVNIDILDAENGESVKSEVIKRFKSARVELRDHHVEVRLK